MSISRPLFPDGHDVYTNDLDFMSAVLEAEVTKRLGHITNAKGVADGMEISAQAGQLSVSAGEAYDGDRTLLDTAGVGFVVPIVSGDAGKYLIVENVVSDGSPGTHPVTGLSADRRRTNGTQRLIVTTPTANQVKLCKIITDTGTPTFSTAAVDRDLLALGIGVAGGTVTNPFWVVALDGSGDFTTIAAAIAALPAGGGMIFVKAGTYPITASILLNKSAVRLVGTGASTIISMDDTAGGGSIMLDIDGSGGGGIQNISIEDLAFDWSADPGAGDNAAIQIEDAVDVTIKRCVFLDGTGIATPHGIIMYDGAHDIRIRGCWSDDMETGILGKPTTTSTRVIITGCRFAGAANGFELRGGCTAWNMTKCKLSGNSAALSKGIWLIDADDCVISGMELITLFENGIEVSAGTDIEGVVITANQIVGNTAVGVNMTAQTDNCLVVGNNLRSNPSPVVDVGGAGNVVQDNVS